MDIIKIAEKENIPALIVQADMAKAFDKVAICAITGSLEYFGFPNFIIDWFKTLYKNFYVCVQNNGFFSDKIHIQCSVHQGAPASAAIFVCVAEILAISLRNNNNIKGVYVQEILQMLNQYADDTDSCIDGSDEKSLEGTINMFNSFAKLTGCDLNYDKTNCLQNWLSKGHKSSVLHSG